MGIVTHEPKMRSLLVLSGSALANKCQPLATFLADFGNHWSSECHLTNSGDACSASCGDEKSSEAFYCSCNHETCYWIPRQIPLQPADWSFSSATETGAKSRHAHLVESYATESSWGALWRFRFRANTALNWGWALRVATNVDLADIDV